MFIPALTLTISLVVIVVLVLVYRYEEREGVRILKNVRLHLDYYILKAEHNTRHFFQYLSINLLRQVLHYLFHTVLGAILNFLKHYEKRVQELQRTNRIHARKSKIERTTRNKLDEIAEHKIAVALTDEEKRHRRQKTLLGG